jgi:hypothetical protein
MAIARCLSRPSQTPLIWMNNLLGEGAIAQKGRDVVK